MKTFLWTTLFWIIVAIAGLLCLGFGNLGTQVLDNSWIVKFLPNNLQSQVCDPIIASTVEGMDWCSAAEEKGCYQEDEVQEESESINIEELVESLNILSTNQETIYNQMNSSFGELNSYFTNLQQMINNLGNICSAQYGELAYVEEQPVIDEREQQRLELQAQIEALQNEMNNL